MDYKSLCKDKHELRALEKLEQAVNCDYAKHHHLYWQGAQSALDVFKDMLWNRRNGG
jgi:hypothetical protein